MVFSSLSFLCIFFPVVFALNQVLPTIKAKNILLLIASVVFYSFGEPVYVVLMLISALANWAAGIALTKTVRRRFAVVCAIVANLGLLVVFKYADMLIGCVNGLFGLQIPATNLPLPIGISFFTFQAMSYVIDVYRGEVTAQKNFLNVLLYISFFPQLIAGPIVKYHDIAKQLSDRHADVSDIANGLSRYCICLSKKVLIDNNMSVADDYWY